MSKGPVFLGVFIVLLVLSTLTGSIIIDGTEWAAAQLRPEDFLYRFCGGSLSLVLTLLSVVTFYRLFPKIVVIIYELLFIKGRK